MSGCQKMRSFLPDYLTDAPAEVVGQPRKLIWIFT
jgi:hypothetical protein